MSFNNIKTKSQSERGFTIVELLIVIVVIGILAAITIVSFNGVTARANKTSGQTAAASALKKAEAYNADPTTPTSGYPTLPSQLTSSTALAQPYGLSGVTFATTALAAAPTSAQGPSTLNFYKCSTAATGIQVAYWDYAPTTGNARLSDFQTVGTCTGAYTFVAGNL